MSSMQIACFGVMVANFRRQNNLGGRYKSRHDTKTVKTTTL